MFLAALAFVVGVWVLIDLVWVTDEEEVLAAVERGRRAAEERDAATIESLFVPGFEKAGIPAADLIESALLILDQYEIRSVVIRERRAEPSGEGYDAEAVARLGVTPARIITEVEVRMHFTRTADGWRVSRFDIFHPDTGEPVEPVR
jgi:hypothetical protein